MVRRGRTEEVGESGRRSEETLCPGLGNGFYGNRSGLEEESEV